MKRVRDIHDSEFRELAHFVFFKVSSFLIITISLPHFVVICNIRVVLSLFF